MTNNSNLLSSVIDQTADQHVSQLHIMYNGRTYDIPLSDLDIGALSSDEDIRRTAAEHLDVPPSKFLALQVDRNEQTGDITMRPDYVLGATAMQEVSNDERITLLNSLLTCPHRDMKSVLDIHSTIISADPLFYTKLAAWYAKNGKVRDHQQMFVTQLCLSDDFRNEGLAMLREMPVYQIRRIVDFIHSDLKRNIPNSMVTEITRYLRERENDIDWFTSNVLTARKHLKRLYALLHVNPSELAQAILFDENPPAGSKLDVIKQFNNAKTPAEQAEIIIENKLPYRIASTIIDSMTPTVLLALITVMTDQELINNIGSLRKRGALDHPDLKELVSSRLQNAHKDKRVDTIKASKAAKVAGASDDVTEALNQVTNQKIASGRRITRNTALLIDKSLSMSQAIEVGKHVGSLVGALMDADFYVYTFDTLAYPINRPKDNGYTDWEKAFKGIRAGQATSCGVGIDALYRKDQQVDQIIMITDQGENTAPRFYTSLVKYREKYGDTSVIFVNVGATSRDLENRCRNHDIEYMSYDFNGDYYALSNLIPFLTAPSKGDLIMEILDTPLPVRRSA